MIEWFIQSFVCTWGKWEMSCIPVVIIIVLDVVVVVVDAVVLVDVEVL